MGMYCEVQAVTVEEAQRLRSAPAGGLAHCRSPAGRILSLEKSWHGLHYLLTGSACEGNGPLGFLLQGGEVLGAESADDGPGARFFSPDATKTLDAALADITDDRLWERFDPERMTEEGVYPGIWDEPEDDLREEYLSYFHALKKVVHEAVTVGHGLLVSIG